MGENSGFIGMVIVLIVLFAVMGGLFWHESKQMREAREACYENAEEPIFWKNGNKCVDVADYRNVTLELIRNNEPVTRGSVRSVTGLGYYTSEMLLERLAEEGHIYQYDRGWSSPGWKMVK